MSKTFEIAELSDGDMTKLILHIGQPKTGTSALQSVMQANADRLLKVDVLYPTRAQPRSAKHALAGPYLMGRAGYALQRHTGLRGAALDALSAKYWASLCAEIRATPHRTLILSSEGFFSVSVPRQPGYRERLAQICDTVEVVAYLRSPASSFLSRMNQNVRMMRGVGLGAKERYRPVIEAYHAAGFDRLSLNVFAPARLINRDILDDFCARYLPADLPPLQRDGVEQSNESVSTEALVILDELRALAGDPMVKDPRRPRAVALLRAADVTLEGRTRPVLRPEIAAALAARATDLPWLRDTCGIVFDDVDPAALSDRWLPDLGALTGVADFSPVDAARLAAMRAMTGAPLARLYNTGWMARLYRRVSGRAR